jgi:prepilin-type N-terminal cleavage/methylation domain-containing protein
MNRISETKRRWTTQGGFSLVELMVALTILTIVFAVLASGMSDIQKKSASDVSRLGVAQETRQFMDQILRDLRQTGYPSQAMFDATTLPSYASSVALTCDTSTTARCCASDNNVACGLVSFSSSAIQFEGDIDGSGVSEVYLQVVVPAGGSCPCTVQRGTVLKSIGGTPAYYTELDNVMSQNVFTAYKYDGSTYNSTTDSLSNIKNIGVTLYVQNTTPDVNNSVAVYPTTTMVSEARINN